MSTIELLAVIIAAVTLAKIIVISINLKAWDRFVDPIYFHPAISTVIFTVLLGVTGYYVLQELTIVQVYAALLPLAMLMGLGMFPYTKALLKWRKEIEEEGVGKDWYPIIIWTVLSVWVLYAVLLA